MVTLPKTTERRRIAWGIALLAWIAFIWTRSLFDGPSSLAQSSWVVKTATQLFDGLSLIGPDVLSVIVRKGAHFLEYLILGILAVGALRPFEFAGSLRVWRWVAVLVILAVVPAADETIQLFVPGHSGMVVDMLLDMAGGMTGIAFSSIVWMWHIKPEAAKANEQPHS